ncbi:beta-L-arabinofuranosidase domain-containing protein [Caldifermentibacillus hisashii]|uniref:beta-L-arabinofuranosidase domain-containing protein n=1 Tax=Caldifermentibacillus hisashii TaxID=996558 RepID=UPI003367F9B7
MNNVKLLDGMFKQSQDKGKEYLLYLDLDRLIAPCYEAAGQKPKKPRYGGWEAKEIAGHSIGHWLSAASSMYAATGDIELKNRLEYAIDELSFVQSFDSSGYVSGFSRDCFDQVFSGEFHVEHFSLGGSWVPWYSIHKIYAGLIDTYTLTGNEKALQVVVKLADWAKNGLANLNDDLFQKMLICEHGGMNEAMADLYRITGNNDYLELAKRFCHTAILDPLSKGIDDLEGKHANTQIPKVIGAAKLYNLTGDIYYRNIAEFFWNKVVQDRSYVIGGNSINEHFGPEHSEKLGKTTTETCNTYNMLKLTELIYQWEHRTEYIDFYEKALYNHILASQDPDSGMKTYFVSTEPGHFKVYCTPDDSFWCCTGTGMENPARYTRNIYYQEGDQLYVNLFISSQIELQNKKVILKQETSFPTGECTKLTFIQANGIKMDLHIRIPYWLVGEMEVTVNGKPVKAQIANNYLVITRQWQTGDIVEIRLPMNLHLYISMDDPQKQAIMYGPIVLAGALGTENFPETDIVADHQALNNFELIEVPVLVTNKKDVNKWVNRIDSKLVFETESVGQPGSLKLKLIPFYELHHQRYTVYWKIMSDKEYQLYLEKKRKEQESLNKLTADVVSPNEQQPEIDHCIQSRNSFSGYLNVVHRGWRDARGEEGFFSYQMKIDPERSNFLAVKYFGNNNNIFIDGIEYERNFDILVDDIVIANQKLKNNQPSEGLFDVFYEIPKSLTQGKQKVTVKFKSYEETIAGGVYEVKIIVGDMTN